MFRPTSTLRRALAPAWMRVRDFARDEHGVTAIEFGVLAVPFFTVILAIIQTAVMFLIAQVLDSALEDASRKVRTGEAASYTLDTFRDYICQSTYNLVDCSKIQIKSQQLSDFTKINEAVPQTCNTTTCTWTTDWQNFDPGKGKYVMQVSAYYRYPLMIVLPYFNLKNQPDNYRLLSAIRVFRNEPY